MAENWSFVNMLVMVLQWHWLFPAVDSGFDSVINDEMLRWMLS